MNIIDKVSMKVDFQENEVMPLLHGAFQLYMQPLSVYTFISYFY